jgi:hypothetical protein
MALAVASTFACAGAFAGGGTHHGSNMSSTEVQTPASVDESAPWLTGKPHLAGWTARDTNTTIGFQEGQFSDGPVGTSSAVSAMGSGGYDSTGGTGGYGLSRSDAQTIDSGDSVTIVEYWLLDADPTATGMSSSAGAAGSVGFDSSMSDETNDFMSMPVDSMSLNDSDTLDLTALGDSSFDEYAYGSTESSLEPLAVVYTASAEQIAETIGEATPLLSEHYLVRGPLSQADSQSVIVLEIGPAPQDIALLDSLSRDFWVLTPAYDEG